jgi:hypothetical protein
MKKRILAAAVASLLGASLAFAEDAKVQTASDRVSLFNVPLACPAAPEIGCGSRSEPALLELQRQPGISDGFIGNATEKPEFAQGLFRNAIYLRYEGHCCGRDCRRARFRVILRHLRYFQKSFSLGSEGKWWLLR